MRERLEDAVHASKSSPRYSKYVEKYLECDSFSILSEIHLIDINVEQLTSERILANLKFYSGSNNFILNDEDKKISSAIAFYLTFENRKQDLTSLKFYLYTVFILSEFYIKNYFQELSEIQICLESFFFYESRKILYILKEKVLLSNEISHEEKEIMLEIFKNWLNNNNDFTFISLEPIFNILMKLEYILASVDRIKKVISDENNMLLNSSPLKLKNEINYIITNSLVDSKQLYKLLESILNGSSFESNKRQMILNQIQTTVIEYQFPLANPMIEYIEKLMPDFFKYKLIDYSQIKKYVSDFFNNYDKIIDSSYQIYLETKTSEEVNSDIVLVRFLATFMSFYEDLHPLMLKDLDQKQEFKNYFSIKTLLLSVLKSEKKYHSIILDVFIREMASDITKTYKGVFKKFIKKTPNLTELSQELKQDFRRRAACHPFITILIQFLPNESCNFEECINELISKTYTMTLPLNICGNTLSSRAVVLRRCEEKNFEKAALFYVWLHEAAHFLQRINVDVLGEADRPFSADCEIKLNIKEDVEENFGEFSNEEALEKILNCKLGKSLNKKLKNKEETDFDVYEKPCTLEDEEKNQQNELKESEQKIKLDEETEDIFNVNLEIKKNFKIQTKNLPGVEGGKFLEFALFGRQYDTLYSRGAEFLLSNVSTLSLPKFRKLFNEKNIPLDNEAGYPLRTGDFISLGRCPGYSYSFQFIIN